MTIQDKAEQLAKVNRQANAILAGIRKQTNIDAKFIEEQLKKFIRIKLMLTENEVSDNITLMVQISIAKSLNVKVTELPGIDKPGQCGNASAVLAKRIQLFLAVQKGLNVSIPAKKTPVIKTVHDLTSVLMPLM